MSASLGPIIAALEGRMKALFNPLPTQWENRRFTPPPSEYQRVNFLPGNPENPTMGDAFRREIGIMQVTLLYPLNGGAGPARAEAERIRDWFPRGSSFTSGVVTVTIQRDGAIGPGQIGGDRYIVPISFRYFANITG